MTQDFENQCEDTGVKQIVNDGTLVSLQSCFVTGSLIELAAHKVFVWLYQTEHKLHKKVSLSVFTHVAFGVMTTNLLCYCFSKRPGSP